MSTTTDINALRQKLIAKAIDKGHLPPDIADYALRAAKQPAALAGGSERADPAVVADFEGKGLSGPRAEELGQLAARRSAEKAQLAAAEQQLVDQLEELKSVGSSVSRGSAFPLGGQAPPKTLVEQTRSKAEKLEQLRREAYELERELGKTSGDRRPAAGVGARRESRRSVARGVHFGGQDDVDYDDENGGAPPAPSRRQSEVSSRRQSEALSRRQSQTHPDDDDDDADIFQKPTGPRRQSMPAPPSKGSGRQSGARPTFQGRRTYAPDPAAARDSFIPKAGPPNPQVRKSFASRLDEIKQGKAAQASLAEAWGRAQAGPLADAPDPSAGARDAGSSGARPTGSEPAGSSASAPPTEPASSAVAPPARQPSGGPLPDDPQSDSKASGPRVGGEEEKDGKRSDGDVDATEDGFADRVRKRKSSFATWGLDGAAGGGTSADPAEAGT